MHFLLFIISTICFGFSIVMIVKKHPWSLMLQLSISWLVGSMTTSIIVFIFSYFLAFDKTLVNGVFIFQIICFSLTVFYFWRYGSKAQKITWIYFEKSPWLYLSLLIVGIPAYFYIRKFYIQFPHRISYSARMEIEFDHGVMASIINGVNFRRKNFLHLSDPFLVNATIKDSPLPFVYSACLALNSQYYNSFSLIISFFNILSTALAVFVLSTAYTKFPLLCVVLFFYNGGWSLFRLYNTKNHVPDLINDVGREYHVPFYQVFFKFLIAQKSSSFTIPIAIFSFSLLQTSKTGPSYKSAFLLSGLIASLVPKFSVSIALFLAGASFPNSVIYFLPFAISLIPKYDNSRYLIKPLWREYQMNGVFFSQIICWLDAFGPLIFTIFRITSLFKDQAFTHAFLSSFSTFLMACFFREGGDYRANALIISSIFYPFLCIAFVRFMTESINSSKGQTKGVKVFLFVSMILVYVIGALVSINRQLDVVVQGMSKETIQMGFAASKLVPQNETVLAPFIPMNPISVVAGRQLVGTEINTLWARGENTFLLSLINYQIESGEDIVRIMKDLGVSYLFELKSMPIVTNNPVKMQNFSVLHRNECGFLLKSKNE